MSPRELGTEMFVILSLSSKGVPVLPQLWLDTEVSSEQARCGPDHGDAAVSP